MTKTMTRLLAAATLCVLPTVANAAVTYDVQNGKLMAIRGINGTPLSEYSDGTYFEKGVEYRTLTDVEFTDGKCANVLGICGDDGKYFAMTRRVVDYVVPYLRDGIVVNGVTYDFDRVPSLINGCADKSLCTIYAGLDGGFMEQARTYIIDKTSGSFRRNFGEGETAPDFDTTSLADTTFARVKSYAVRVSPVPEPATWALMLAGFGLTATALRRRRVRFAAVPA